MDLQQSTPDLTQQKNGTKPTPKPQQRRPSRSKSKTPNLTPIPANLTPIPDPQNLPEENAASVLVEIEQPEPKKGSIFSDLIKSASGPKEKKDAPKSKKENADASELAQDFPTIITSILALTFSALAMPEEIKPNEAEITAVSYHASRIMLRHIDVTNKLNADALDIVGILATGAGWYMRVSIYMKPGKTGEAKNAPPVTPAAETPPVDGSGAMIQNAAAAEFLENSAKNAELRQ